MITNYKDGYCVCRNMVPPNVVDQYRRLFLLEIVNWGLPKEQFDEWHQTKAWFPTLREQVKPLVEYVPSGFKMGELCEPQILLHFPDEAEEWEIFPHKDEEPPWANGRRYRTIAGIALTDQQAMNGGLINWGLEEEPYESYEAYPIGMRAGDIVIFNPKLWHSSELNRTGEIRMMVYFRWLND